MCVEFPGLFKKTDLFGRGIFYFLIKLFDTVMLCDEHDEHGLKSNSSQAGVRDGNSDWKKTGAFSI